MLHQRPHECTKLCHRVQPSGLANANQLRLNMDVHTGLNPSETSSEMSTRALAMSLSQRNNWKLRSGHRSLRNQAWMTASDQAMLSHVLTRRRNEPANMVQWSRASTWCLLMHCQTVYVQVFLTHCSTRYSLRHSMRSSIATATSYFQRRLEAAKPPFSNSQYAG